jgi:ectoine hydroxylase-related dioxygenase (phytanoyl-CoA dioxygenase family)
LVDFLPNKGRVFINLLMHQTALDYASGVFNPLPFRVGLTGALISKRGMRRQFLHRDEVAIPHDMCTRPTLINILVCLSDFEEDMGATHIAPGTHILPPPWEMPDSESIPLIPAVAEAGDALMWEGRTWHAGGAHCSDKTRYAISTWYSLAGVTPDQIYTSSLHDDVYGTLTTKELEVLGFRVQSDDKYINRIAPRSAHDRQRNTNRATPYVPELRRNASRG